jgi:hypothetical protein
LNEIATQKGTFQNLGKEVKKPSDISESGDPGANIIAPPLRQLPPPNVNSKRLKELLDKRRDRGFETPDDLVTGLTAEEIFKITELDPDGKDKKKATKVERYYQQLERANLGNTNQVKSDDLVGLQKSNDERDDSTSHGTEKTPGIAANPATQTFRPLFSGDSSSMFFPDNKPRSSADGLGFGNVEAADAMRAEKTRLQNFKQLLDAGPLAPPINPGNSSVPTASPGLSPARRFDSLPGTSSRGSFGSPPSTIPGAPLGLPGSHQNLTPPPPPRQALPPPTFELPKRKF